MPHVLTDVENAPLLRCECRLKETIVPTKRPYYNTLESPDVWFDAREVWELRGADLSLSPVHRAAVGRVHGERGLGLRFPRFLRIRDDKGIEDATSAATVAEAYGAQERKVQVAAQAVAAAKEKEASEDAEADGEEGRKEAGNLDI